MSGAAAMEAKAESAAGGAPVPRALYFCGSIRGGRGDEERALYARIVARLRRFGAVLTEHVADAELSARGEAGRGGARGGR